MDDALSNSSSKPENPKKSSTSNHFLFRAAVLALILVLIPLFPSLAPQFFNSSLHARSWELIQLIFVGLAVSYGLFSRKNDDSDKDCYNQSSNSQSYFSRLLHVSSVFDDDNEENGNEIPGSKVQKWSLMYQKEDDPVVVAKEKPLLLPVRTLKQRLHPETESLVLPSPIPWRSRSSSSRIESEQDGIRIRTGTGIGDQFPEIPAIKELKKTLSSPLPPPPPPPPPPPYVKTTGRSSSSAGAFRSNSSIKMNSKYEVPSAEDSDSEAENDGVYGGGGSGSGEKGYDDAGPDVDKKADEFIAKFREQIRLQRIESIRRSTAQRSAKG